MAKRILPSRQAGTLAAKRWAFEAEVEALERMCELASMQEERFYLDLLRTPLTRRFAKVVEWVQAAVPGRPRATALAEVARLMVPLKKS